ncbi:hypothetical protein [Brevibacillus choshinensis]|uniref:Uncharacterized protein n=1 Tax=Brevibacillus choshinensis TaxID=54911 RepID=A0ABX7FKQ5_BRECH|nr:hypothetical protein [Brevibacillus choshinensis]QRG66811.1 hypothetical protein JNE38_25560 [Brevibacillus choshinensis]
MKSTRTLLALALAGIIALTGCASANTTSSNATSAPAPAAEEKASEIKAGTTKMLEITAELKKAIEAGDESTVVTLGPKFEEAWGPFEDKVKEKYADLYKKVEDALDPTIAGTEASPLDKDALGKFNEQLTQALTELADKEK